MWCAVTFAQNWKKLHKKTGKQLVNDYLFSPKSMCIYGCIIFETRTGMELSELWNSVFIWGVNIVAKNIILLIYSLILKRLVCFKICVAWLLNERKNIKYHMAMEFFCTGFQWTMVEDHSVNIAKAEEEGGGGILATKLPLSVTKIICRWHLRALLLGTGFQ